MLFLLALLLPLLADPARGLRGADTPPTPFLAQTRSGDHPFATRGLAQSPRGARHLGGPHPHGGEPKSR
jgi:hypothetical protein